MCSSDRNRLVANERRACGLSFLFRLITLALVINDSPNDFCYSILSNFD